MVVVNDLLEEGAGAPQLGLARLNADLDVGNILLHLLKAGLLLANLLGGLLNGTLGYSIEGPGSVWFFDLI